MVNGSLRRDLANGTAPRSMITHGETQHQTLCQEDIFRMLQQLIARPAPPESPNSEVRQILDLVKTQLAQQPPSSSQPTSELHEILNLVRQLVAQSSPTALADSTPVQMFPQQNEIIQPILERAQEGIGVELRHAKDIRSRGGTCRSAAATAAPISSADE